MPARKNATKTDDEVAVHDAVTHAVMNATPSQIDAWIENNVTDMASAKQVLKVIVKILVSRLQ